MNHPPAHIAMPEITSVLSGALADGVIGTIDTTVQFHDLGRLRRIIATLIERFPAKTNHAIAIKANPLVAVLQAAVKAGAGLEAASMEEVQVALAAGCPPDRIIFDSPAKTENELRQALELGLMLNIDNFDELARIEALHQGSTSVVGFRVNPQVGAGSIAITSVSTGKSKFGVPITGNEPALLDAFRRNPWLRALHVHVGSQGCRLEQLVNAVEAILALRDRLNTALGEPQIDNVDIGGGLPFPYTDDDEYIRFEDYADALHAQTPALFTPGLQVATEFGRAIQAGCGFTASRIEYVKRNGEQRLAVCHAGADLFMRPVYQPDTWRHRFSLVDAHGQPREGDCDSWTIAGPLCFAGDLLAQDLPLPEPRPGDWLIIHDTGAYTLGMYSRHCSRGLPLVLGFDSSTGERRVMLQRETPKDVARFWSAGAELD